MCALLCWSLCLYAMCRCNPICSFYLDLNHIMRYSHKNKKINGKKNIICCLFLFQLIFFLYRNFDLSMSTSEKASAKL